MSDAPVLTTVDARGVGTITLNRPEVNNAYDASVVNGMVDAVTQVANDPAVRVVVIRGNRRHVQARAARSWG